MFLGPPKTALVIAPHADDEVLGAGGLMARLSAEGWSVVVAYVTVSGFSSSATGGRSDSAARWEEACAACRVLGVSPHAVLFDTEAHHLKLDTVPQVELIGFIEGVLQETRPALLLIPAGGHFHQDHLATTNACRAALRPGSKLAKPVELVLEYGAGNNWWGAFGSVFNPNFYVDISDVLEQKVKALLCYTSQVMPAPHPRSSESVVAYAAATGVMIGAAYAEPYIAIRHVIR